MYFKLACVKSVHLVFLIKDVFLLYRMHLDLLSEQMWWKRFSFTTVSSRVTWRHCRLETMWSFLLRTEMYVLAEMSLCSFQSLRWSSAEICSEYALCSPFSSHFRGKRLLQMFVCFPLARLYLKISVLNSLRALSPRSSLKFPARIRYVCYLFIFNKYFSVLCLEWQQIFWRPLFVTERPFTRTNLCKDQF